MYKFRDLWHHYIERMVSCQITHAFCRIGCMNGKGERKMDNEWMPTGGFPFTELPLGFGMSLAMNEAAMQGYARLTEDEKEKIIMRCKDASSKEEMQRIVDSLVPDGNVSSLYEEG